MRVKKEEQTKKFKSFWKIEKKLSKSEAELKVGEVNAHLPDDTKYWEVLETPPQYTAEVRDSQRVLQPTD